MHLKTCCEALNMNISLSWRDVEEDCVVTELSTHWARVGRAEGQRTRNQVLSSYSTSQIISQAQSTCR